MKKANLGDVYAFPTERGYRIMQWAYRIERYGDYIKVFPGFYSEKPENLEVIAKGDCAYIINVNAPKIYRKGIFELWGNFPVSDPFPTYDLFFNKCGKAILFEVCEFIGHRTIATFIGDSAGTAIPEKYKNLRLLNCMPHPFTFLYLLESNFDLNHYDRFWPEDASYSEIDRKYGALLFGEDRKKRF